MIRPFLPSFYVFGFCSLQSFESFINFTVRSKKPTSDPCLLFRILGGFSPSHSTVVSPVIQYYMRVLIQYSGVTSRHDSLTHLYSFSLSVPNSPSLPRPFLPLSLFIFLSFLLFWISSPVVPLKGQRYSTHLSSIYWGFDQEPNHKVKYSEHTRFLQSLLKLRATRGSCLFFGEISFH